MCGLIAIRGGDPDLLLRAARRGLDAIAHRGPDGEGLHACDSTTILAHRRLSILDLSAAAAQPMVCPATGNVVVFNGEIYNFLELRAELEGRGERFRGDGDTEVLLAGWRIWGRDLFARCDGMWAIVIFEQSSGDLIACRDRLGVKPLYLHRVDQRIMLASEIGAVAAMRGSYPDPNPGSVFDFLTLGLSGHTHETFFRGIETVPPGEVWRIARDGVTTSWTYHRWPRVGEAPPLVAADARELVCGSTALRLRSDVPTVALLSGGLDSSILTTTALACEHRPRVTFAGAFTYGYADREFARFDETEAAAALMRGLGAPERHHVCRGRAVPDEIELAALVRTQEEPFSTPSILASYRTYKAIRDTGYKVALTGEGADEAFGGYSARYQPFAVRDALHSANLTAALRLLRRGARVSLVANRMAWDLPLPLLARLLRARRPSVGMIARELWSKSQLRLAVLQEDMRVDLQERLRRDVLSTSLPQILRITDRNAMRFGVEVRSPFLDYRLIERALATPSQQLMGSGQGKELLRRAFSHDLQPRVAWQNKSTGFGHAEQFLVSRMPIARLLDDVPPGLDAFVDVARLRAAASGGDLHPTFWLAVSVALWYRSIYG